MIGDLFFLFVVFFFGACVGSFMDVVRVRGSWRKSLFGRSACGNCGVSLRWKVLIPVISYILLRGSCRSCSSRIPVYHLFSELSMGMLFVFAFVFSDSLYVTGAVLLSSVFLVPISLEDFQSMEVPEHLSVPFSCIAFIVAVGLSLHLGHILPIVGGLLLAAPFYLLWRFSSGRMMGLGDAKLALPLGFLLPNLSGVVSVFIFSFWIGTLMLLLQGLYMRLTSGSFGISRGMQMPLAPSIALSFLVVFLGDFSFFSIISGMQSLFVGG